MNLYPKGLVRATVGRGRMQLAHRRVARYRDLSTPEIVALQIEMADRVWVRALHHSAFYQWIKREHGLPGRITALQDLANFPVVDKQMLGEHQDLVWQDQDPDNYYVTGGSTGTPTRFPRGAGELSHSLEAVGCYRQHWGILPFDRYLYIGGAAHRLTSGRHATLRRADRWARDRLVNGGRIDGWSTRPDDLGRNAAVLQRFRPEVVIGFPSKILRIAHHLIETGQKVPSVRRIILSSENVSAPEVVLIERAFDAPVLLEYGSEEVGLIAASWDDTWPMRVMFDAVVVTCGPDGQARITTLAPRAFPLVNYALGDRIRPEQESEGSVLSIAEVEGRAREQLLIPLRGAQSASSMPLALVVVLKQRPGVIAAQFVQGAESLDVHVQLADGADLANVRNSLRDGLLRLHPDVDLGRIRIGVMEHPDLTSRQKLKVVLETSPSGAKGPMLSLA